MLKTLILNPHGSKMPRCSAKTLTGRRCKHSAGESGLCFTHGPISAEATLAPTHEEDEPLYSPNKVCGHTCELHTQKCCGCLDLRPLERTYPRYVDQVGILMIGRREDDYCKLCKVTFHTPNWVTSRLKSMRQTIENSIPSEPLLDAAITVLETAKTEINTITDEINLLINEVLMMRPSMVQ